MGATMSLPSPRTTLIDGRQLSWREAGEGPALVLVHGIGTDSRLWDLQFGTFASGYRVVAWDAPGYGASSPFPAAAPSKRDYADALSRLLAHLRIDRPHIVGHSLGAVMVAALCRDGLQPMSVTLMHPVTGAGRLDPEKRAQIRKARIDDMRSLGPKAFAQARGPSILGKAMSEGARMQAVANMAEVTADGYLQAWEMMCGASIFDDLDAIGAPCMVLCGGDDPVAPEASCREIAARLPPGAIFRLFPGVGHSLPAEDPSGLNLTLASFLDTVRAQTTT